MAIQTFDFEGQQLTVRQICEIVPAFSDCQVRKHLKAGRNTRDAMLNWSPIEAARRGGRKGKQAAERAGFSQIAYGRNMQRKGN
jgi:hypothetical protein